MKVSQHVEAAPVLLGDLDHHSIKRHNSKHENTASQDAHEYEFLLERCITRETLDEAVTLAAQWHVPVHEVLISKGWLSQASYTKALAEYSGIPYIQKFASSQLNLPNIPEKIQNGYRAGLFTGTEKGQGTPFEMVILASTSPKSPSALKKMMSRFSNANERLFLVSTHQLRYAITAAKGSLLTKEAIFGLNISHPYCCASHGLTWQQKLFLILTAIIYTLLLITFTKETLTATSLLLSALFFPIVWLRYQACRYTWRRPFNIRKKKKKTVGSWRQAATGLSNNATLPVYTILVPIFKEKEVISTLIQSLLQIDYPAAKLDIKLIFEECDHETLEAAQEQLTPDHFEFIIVPDSQPRTKPKALNYAMQFARGEYVVIYDAEDQPAPDQLKKAVTAFRLAPQNVACLQARLTFYNDRETWLTKQFAIEYNALFNGLLPTLQKLDFPIPLGGTSNHFRMSALKHIGGWDAFNVTEDADLGIRLYRFGYTCRVLNSVTWEEATCTLKGWIPQRTRWIKGWLQTYAVHMRNPFRLYKQLGLRAFLGFHITIGGFLASAFIHPVFLAYAAFFLTSYGTNISWHWFLSPYSLVTLFCLFMGYTTAMCLGAIVSLQAGKRSLVKHVFTMPVYWLLISMAAYRALLQFFLNPFHWEKTKHGVSKIQRKKRV